MNDTVRTELEELRKLNTTALKAKYLELFGEQSRSSNYRYLYRRAAWRLQALAEGDLSERARERAAKLAVDADLRLRPPHDFLTEIDAEEPNQPKPHRDARLPSPGTELRRKYNDQLICVKVLADGFEYNGKQYASLSAIAYRATRTRWNGFSFFGLSKQVANG
jgi:hypothetical protein